MPSRHERFAFAIFVVDPAERLLLRDGVAVPLRDKVFETLLVLVRNPGRLLTREEMMLAIWPDAVVEEANLNQNISELRRALGDATFIQTVPKRGFRFVAPMRPDIPQTPAVPRGLFHAGAATLLVAALALPLGSHGDRVADPIRSVSVIPFESHSGAGGANAAASMTEVVRNRLGTIPRVVVKLPDRAASSADPIAAGERIAVDSVLTGSILSSGTTLHITAAMHDVHRRVIVWTRSFDCAAADLPIIEKALANDLVAEFHPGITAEERARLRPPNSRDAIANDEYLRGRELLDSRTDFPEAIVHFEHALARDPNFAMAWAALAETLAHPQPHVAPAVLARATNAARRAIALDPLLPEAHATLGFIHLFYDWQWDAAERELRFAIRADPFKPRFHDWYALVLMTRGKMADAVREVEYAHQLDPQSADITGDVYLLHFEARDYYGAETAARMALALDPSSRSWHEYLAFALMREKNPAGALAEFASIGSSDSELRLNRALVRAEIDPTDTAELRKLMQTVTAEKYTWDAIATDYAILGQNDKAIECLERAYNEHAFGLIFLGVAPEWDSLRDDPRFQDLVRRVGVVEVAHS